jgi:hypothetical protein
MSLISRTRQPRLKHLLRQSWAFHGQKPAFANSPDRSRHVRAQVARSSIVRGSPARLASRTNCISAPNQLFPLPVGSCTRSKLKT